MKTITKEQAEKFQSMLTPAEKKALEKSVTHACKDYFVEKAKTQESLQSNFINFMNNKRKV